jgi:PAS domain S-box-containing protein
LVFLLTFGGYFFYLETITKEQETLQLQKILSSEKIAWRGALDISDTISKVWFKAYIDTPYVKHLLAQANSNNKEQVDKMREELYRYLKDEYDLIKQDGIRQLQFHLPNSDSFLRFHKKDTYGDNLANSRYSVEFANRALEKSSGFEIGKIFIGFRNVWPMTREPDEHLGSVEVSFSFRSIRDELERLLGNSEIELVLYKPMVEKKLFENQMHLYTPWVSDSEYMIEDADATILNDSPKKLDKTSELLSKTIKDSPKLKQILQSKSSGVLPVRQEGEMYTVSLMEIKNIKDEHAGYLVSYQISPELQELYNRELYSLLIGGVLAFVISVLIYSLLKSKESIGRRKKELETIYETIDEGLYITDENGVIIEVNEAASKMLGYSKEELLGSDAHKLFHDAGKQNRECEVLHNSSSEEGLKFNEKFRCKDGSEIIVRVHSKSYSSESNSRIIVSFDDITDEIEEKEVMAHFNELLERQVQAEIKSVKKLQEEKEQQNALLIQQSKMAEMGNMIGAIAHQWKQPLNAISLTATIIEDYYIDGELSLQDLEKHLKVINQQVHFMSRTIDDFRSFFKPNKETEKFSIKDAVEKVISLLSSQIKNHGIEISVDGDSNIYIDGHKNEFKQVVLNIINNAKDAIEERGVSNKEIIISIKEKENSAVLKIEDSAGGIPEHLLPEEIFKSFVSTKGDNGTGIGLSLAKDILKKIGGSIKAYNKKDGAVFEITVPTC